MTVLQIFAPKHVAETGSKLTTSFVSGCDATRALYLLQCLTRTIPPSPGRTVTLDQPRHQTVSLKTPIQFSTSRNVLGLVGDDTAVQTVAVMFKVRQFQAKTPYQRERAPNAKVTKVEEDHLSAVKICHHQLLKLVSFNSALSILFDSSILDCCFTMTVPSCLL